MQQKILLVTSIFVISASLSVSAQAESADDIITRIESARVAGTADQTQIFGAMQNISQLCENSGNALDDSQKQNCMNKCATDKWAAKENSIGTLGRLWGFCRQAYQNLGVDLSSAKLSEDVAVIAETESADPANSTVQAEVQEADKADIELAQTQIEKADKAVEIPESLKSVELIEIDQEKSAETKEKFVNNARRHSFLNERCYEKAFEHARSAYYWKELEGSAEFINELIAKGQFPNTFETVSAQTASGLCDNPEFVSALSQGRGGTVGKMRGKICELAGKGMQASFDPDASAIINANQTICIDQLKLKEDEYAACMKSASTMQGFGVHDTAEHFCACSSEKRAAYFEGEVVMNSDNLTKSAVDARTHCRKSST